MYRFPQLSHPRLIYGCRRWDQQHDPAASFCVWILLMQIMCEGGSHASSMKSLRVWCYVTHSFQLLSLLGGFLLRQLHFHTFNRRSSWPAIVWKSLYPWTFHNSSSNLLKTSKRILLPLPTAMDMCYPSLLPPTCVYGVYIIGRSDLRGGVGPQH